MKTIPTTCCHEYCSCTYNTKTHWWLISAVANDGWRAFTTNITLWFGKRTWACALLEIPPKKSSFSTARSNKLGWQVPFMFINQFTITAAITKYHKKWIHKRPLHQTPNYLSVYVCVSLSAPRQETVVEKLQHEVLPTGIGTFYSSHTERWEGWWWETVYECFTLCWLGSLGHHSSAWVLFTAFPAHEVSLPGLERGQSSSVSSIPLLGTFSIRTTTGHCRLSQSPNGCPPSH